MEFFVEQTNQILTPPEFATFYGAHASPMGGGCEQSWTDASGWLIIGHQSCLNFVCFWGTAISATLLIEANVKQIFGLLIEPASCILDLDER